MVPAPREEEEEHRTSPQPKRRRLDRKNGKGLAKDATRPVATLISESQEEMVFTGDIADNQNAGGSTARMEKAWLKTQQDQW